jgi:hypothetical protein
MNERLLRMMAASLGIGVALFSGASLLSPRRFAHFFGISAPDPSVDSMIYSIGARDVAMGMGLWSAATHGGKYAPWLLARLIADGGDAAGIAVAVARGWRTPRFLALGGLALGAAACDAILWSAARRTASPQARSSEAEGSLASTGTIK